LFNSKQSAVRHEPIFTIPLAGHKIHVVRSTDLASAALRHKNLSFDPWVRKFCRVVLECSPKTLELLEPRHHSKMEGYNKELYRAISHSLSDVASLREMNTKSLGCAADSLNALTARPEAHNLYSWVTEFLTDTMSTALFGDDNPLRNDPSMKATFW
jgi:hypothetical protein